MGDANGCITLIIIKPDGANLEKKKPFKNNSTPDLSELYALSFSLASILSQCLPPSYKLS